MTSYASALRSLATIAKGKTKPLPQKQVPITECIGLIVAEDVLSPVSTPAHDTSAMDGYALSSEATQSASPETPIILHVSGTIAAGDDPTTSADFPLNHTIEPCVEIMTGGIFPSGIFSGRPLDACVKVEETACVSDRPSGPGRLIMITKPVRANANRRLAGGDMKMGATLLTRGTLLNPQHLMVLASVGISEIAVLRRPRVGVWSTGQEIASSSAGGIPDSNGPYITAALRAMGAQATFLGTLSDDDISIACSIQTAAKSNEFDILVTTGGVSMGKFDFLAPSLVDIGADIIFHGLEMRPGHPVLFASLQASESRTVAVFGLPGNPGAAAVCFRFLVCPYLDALQGKPPEKPIFASLGKSPPSQGCVFSGVGVKSSKTVFKHGTLRQELNGAMVVDINAEQSPAKLSPYLQANCWVRFDPGHPVSGRDLVPCYLMPGENSLV